MKKSILITMLLSGLAGFLFAQSLPAEMYLSDDGRRLVTGGRLYDGFYDSSIVRTIYLDFPQPNYWQLMTQNYNSHTDIPATMTVDGVVYDSVGVRFKGQTSFSMLPPGSQKRSFNISLDYVHPDQKIMGYKTLNLNNSFQDESFMREVFYLHQIRKHIPAARANYVNLYINGQNWGLYPNVQQLNKDYLEEWFLSNDGANWRADRPSGQPGGGPGGGGPGWGDGTAALNYLGADTSDYQTYYTLKSSDIDNPWDHLVATCRIVDDIPLAQLRDSLPLYLDVDRTLWFLASEIAFSDDDSYVYKGKMDYYLYYEPETGRMTPLEFDGNSVMGPNLANWSPFYHADNANYPLLNRMLAVPEWRQRYLAHLRTIIADEMNPSVCNDMLANYQTQIDQLVQDDPKKLYTYQQFLSEISVLRNFITTRRNNLLANSEMAQPGPTIVSANYYNINNEAWTAPLSMEPTTVLAEVSSANGINRVNLYYATGIVGNFSVAQMFDDGQHNDNAANDGIYGATIPGYAAGTWVRFYVEALSNNTAKTAAYFPAGAEHDVFVYTVQANVVANSDVVINELMASNSTVATDNAGEYDDWIELFNKSANDINLSGYYLSDNPENLPKWEFPEGSVIPANGYLIIWADEDGVQGDNHCNFKLSADGEIVMLLDPDLNILDEVTFGPQTTDKGYARVPNGTGPFVIQNPTFNANNNTATSTDDLADKKPEIRAYPNPADQTLHLVLPALHQGYPVEVRNITGQLLYTTAYTTELLTIDVSSWPAGLYIVRCGEAVCSVVVR